MFSLGQNQLGIQQQGSSLFGGNQNTQSGGGLFGSQQNNQQNALGIFGSTNTQQPQHQQNSLFGSVGQNQNQQPQSSLFDGFANQNKNVFIIVCTIPLVY